MYINLLGELNLVSESSQIVSVNLFLILRSRKTSKDKTKVA
jgi:hypothetical protein